MSTESTGAPTIPASGQQAFPNATTAWYAIFLLAVINMLDNIDRGILSLLIEPIKRDLLLSDTEIGMLTGIAYSGFYAIVGLPMSRLTDTGNRKLLLGFGVAFWSFATSMGSFAQTFWHLFFVRGGTGAGESLKGPNAMSMISDLVPRDKLPRAMSLYMAGIYGGIAFSMIIGGALLGVFSGSVTDGPFGLRFTDWQMVFLIVGLPGILLALLFLLTVREPVRRNRKSGEKPPLLDVFRFLHANRSYYYPFLIGTALVQIESVGMTTWRIPFYARTYGLEASVAGPILGGLTLIASPIGLILGAWIGERMARKKDPAAMMKLSLLGLVLSLPAIVAYPLMPSWQLAMAVASLAAVFTGMAVPGSNSAIQVVTPNEYRGQISAIFLFTISVIGTGAAPIAISLFTDFLFEDEAMLRYSMVSVAVIFGFSGLLLKLVALRPYRKRVAEILDAEDSIRTAT